MVPFPPPPAYKFTRDLTIGSKGEDVRLLQSYLNKNGFAVAESGAGSIGKETAYFGGLTRNAVARFHGITPPAGFFGPKTRACVNSNQ